MEHFRILYFCVAFILVEHCANAQREQIPVLRKSLLTLQGEQRIDCLNSLSEAYLGGPSWFADPQTKIQMDSAEIFAEQALEEARSEHYNHGIARALSSSADLAFEKYEDYKKSKTLCQEAITYFTKSATKQGLSKTYWRLGAALYSMSNFDQALKALDTSFAFSVKDNDFFYSSRSLAVTCDICIQKGDYSDAFRRLTLFHNLIATNPDTSWTSYEKTILGDLNYSIGDYNAAIKYYEGDFEGMSEAYAKTGQRDSAMKYFNLYKPDTSNVRNKRFYDAFCGEYFSFLGDYPKAKNHFLNSLVSHQKYHDANQEMRVLRGLANTTLLMKDYESAVKYAHQTLAKATQVGSRQDIRDASQVLAAVFEYRKQPDSAYHYFKLYTTMNDSLVNNQIKGKLTSYTFEQQIDTINKEIAIQQAQLRNEMLQKRFLIGIAIAFLVIATLLLRNNSLKRKANKQMESTLEHLRATQSQLIQSEKMASLGELTAGIAHEIQNPLNFVNNFSEVNKELLAEADGEIDKGNFAAIKDIIKDVISNEEKIGHHGKRADGIVKGMLQHSTSSSGVKEPTDINALADEYLRVAFHGFRAKDKSFNVTTKTEFDKTLGKVNVVPQDIGRVVLNLISNAFYTVSEKKKQHAHDYEPTVTVKTTKHDGVVLISVSDNGNGIPSKVLDKIFQPFFTTKPTGQGTGLGLSLSYDIAKAHGGGLNVETKEGEGSEFTISIPI